MLKGYCFFKINRPKSIKLGDNCLILNKGKIKHEDRNSFLIKNEEFPNVEKIEDLNITFSSNHLNFMCSFEVQKYRNILRRKTVNEKCTYDFNRGKVLWFWLKLNLWIQLSLETLINLYQVN